MDKKLRNQLSEQIGVAVAAILKSAHDGAAGKVEKHIRSASRDLAKKFLKAQKELIKKAEAEKAKALKAVKKVKPATKARKAVKKVSATSKPVKSKRAAKKSAKK
jgi:hypothetical protein